jgi:hypothetical protein
MGKIIQKDGLGNVTEVEFPPFAKRDPLDHDGDGRKGGSLKGQRQKRDK